MKEIWKDIYGYENVYQVSNLGNVRSLDRYIFCKDGSKRFCKGKKLKSRSDKDGYQTTELNKSGKRKFCHIHRLVAMMFIPNDDPINKTQVNHKKEFEKWNNCVTNLEWCTAKENTNYGTRTQRMAKAQSKKVYQYTLDKTFVRLWDSIIQIESELGFNHSNISYCCNGKRKTHKRYIWSYTPLI
ncbi:HNH endonuclease domain protein (plasmid) [Clostridium botulinum C/D str. BKT12695]|nr:HNH endonuclease domain protein [Clostridium botulinum C/D str. BKT12695]